MLRFWWQRCVRFCFSDSLRLDHREVSIHRCTEELFFKYMKYKFLMLMKKITETHSFSCIYSIWIHFHTFVANRMHKFLHSFPLKIKESFCCCLCLFLSASINGFLMACNCHLSVACGPCPQRLVGIRHPRQVSKKCHMATVNTDI